MNISNIWTTSHYIGICEQLSNIRTFCQICQTLVYNAIVCQICQHCVNVNILHIVNIAYVIHFNDHIFKFASILEFGAVGFQKCKMVDLVDIEKSCNMNICSQKSA